MGLPIARSGNGGRYLLGESPINTIFLVGHLAASQRQAADQDIRELSYPINRFNLIPPIDVPTPFLSAPVVSFFGLLDVVVHAQASIGVGVTLEGYIKPLKPELQATLISTARAGANWGSGCASCRVWRMRCNPRLDSKLDVPVTLDVLPSPAIGVDACLTLGFSVRAFASLGWGLLRKDATKKLAEFAGCISDFDATAQATAQATTQANIDPAVPELMASPVIGIGPDGTQLSAYVENTAAVNATPQVQILARFKAPNAAEWQTAVALSNIAHSSSSPVVAFVGPNATPIVAWVEKKLTEAKLQSWATITARCSTARRSPIASSSGASGNRRSIHR